MMSSTDQANFVTGGGTDGTARQPASSHDEHLSEVYDPVEQGAIQALRDSEERLRLAIEAGNIFTWEVDPATRKVTYSANVIEVMGFSLNEYTSQDRDLVHPDDRAFVQGHFARVLRGEEAYKIEHRFVNPENGEIVWVRGQGHLIRDPQGNRSRFVGITQNITERKKAEEKLATLHGQLEAELVSIRRLHEISTSLQQENDPDKLLEKILDAALEITGTDKGNMQLLNPATGELHIRSQRGFDLPFLKFFARVAAESQSCSAAALRGGTRVIVPDTHVSTLYSSAALDALVQADVRATQSTPLVTRGGETLGMLSTHWRQSHTLDDRELRMLDLLAREAADLIERSRSEESLRRRGEEFKAHFNLTSVGNTQVDVHNGRFLLVNAAFCALLGYAEAELLARTIWEVTDPADVEANQALYRAMTGGDHTSFALEKRLLRKDGTPCWVLVNVTVAQRDGAGRPVRSGAVVLDITERKKAEEELRHLNETLERRVEERTGQVHESEERFRALVDASAQIVWTMDAEGRVVEDSPTWRAFTGQSAKEGQGWGWMDAVHPGDRVATMKSWHRAMASALPMDTEFRIHHVGGEWHWMQVRAVPLRNEAGEVQGWVGMNIDISERKRAEADRERLARSLMLAEQEERRRISQVLHDDLQQLLYAIQMRMGIIRQDLDAIGPPDLLDEVEEARSWLKQCVETTRQMTVDLNPPLLKNEGLADALEWLQSQMEQRHGLKVVINAEEKARVVDQDVRTLLFRIVRELLFNVAKHAGVDRVVVDLAREADRLVVHVTDEGQGFDVKAATAGEGQKGGFGLFSAQELLRLIGGHMEVRSQLGTGTHIIISVPVQPERMQ
jgi:PAS domain S-box-containing protein